MLINAVKINKASMVMLILSILVLGVWVASLQPRFIQFFKISIEIQDEASPYMDTFQVPDIRNNGGQERLWLRIQLAQGKFLCCHLASPFLSNISQIEVIQFWYP